MAGDTPQHMDETTLKQVFVHNLNRIYFGKCYLDRQLGHLMTYASFNALKLGIQEFADDIKRQIVRMQEIYALIDEEPSDKNCNPIRSIVKDEFCLSDVQAYPLLTDIDLLSYLQLLEHINITSCRMLKIIAELLQNKEVEQLLIECFDESIDNDQLFTLITKEYIAPE